MASVRVALLEALGDRVGNADPEGVSDPGGWVPQVRHKKPHVSTPSKGRGRASRVVTRTMDEADWERWAGKADPNSPAWTIAAGRLDRIAALRRRLAPARDPELRAELVAELDREVSKLPAPCRGQFANKWKV